MTFITLLACKWVITRKTTTATMKTYKADGFNIKRWACRFHLALGHFFKLCLGIWVETGLHYNSSLISFSEGWKKSQVLAKSQIQQSSDLNKNFVLGKFIFNIIFIQMPISTLKLVQFWSWLIRFWLFTRVKIQHESKIPPLLVFSWSRWSVLLYLFFKKLMRATFLSKASLLWYVKAESSAYYFVT